MYSRSSWDPGKRKHLSVSTCYCLSLLFVPYLTWINPLEQRCIIQSSSVCQGTPKVALPGQKDTDKGRKNDHLWSVRETANSLLFWSSEQQVSLEHVSRELPRSSERKLYPLIVFQRNVLNFFTAKFILQIMLTNFPKPSWPSPSFPVVKEISLMAGRCWRLLNFADLGTEWMKQA